MDATAGTWHDQVTAVADEARNRLRIKETDVDWGRAEGQARAAMRAIDHRLDLRPATARLSYQLGDVDLVWTYPADGAPPDVVEAAVVATMDLLRRKDAPFGVLNASSVTAEPVRISRDILAGAESLLQPYVEGWGFA